MSRRIPIARAGSEPARRLLSAGHDRKRDAGRLLLRWIARELVDARQTARMDAARWAGIAAALIASTLIAGCAGSTHRAPRLPAVAVKAPPLRTLSRIRQPNIVFVLTDDLAWNLVRYMPHVREMEQGGTTFNNYFVTDSLCCPSRATIFTGRFPHDTGIYTNTAPDGGFDAFHAQGEESQTFPVLLQAAGYRTALMGKYLNGYDPRATEDGTTPYVPPGWSEWDVAGDAYHEFNYTLNENGNLVHYGGGARAYLTDVLARKSVHFVDAAAAAHKPFMLEVATFAPHSPFIPAPRDRSDFPRLKAPRTPAFNAPSTNPPGWLANYVPLGHRSIKHIDRSFRRRAQAVQAVDAMIGRLEAELERDHVAGDTYFVFSSDNGLHMGEHRLSPGKLTAFDTDIRVPLIVTGPHVAPGRSLDRLAENTDLAPTFLRLGGVVPPATLDGHSLIGLLDGQPPPAWRKAVLVEHHGRVADPNDPDLPTSGAGNPPSYEAIRTAHDVYVEYADGEREYYDLTTDPFELDNTVSELPPTVQASLHVTLTELENCHNEAACWAAAQMGG